MYKVVKVPSTVANDGRWRSSVISGVNMIYYPEGEWAGPSKAVLKLGYGVIVFDNIGDARSWQQGYPTARVWHCQTRGRMKLPELRGVARVCSYPLVDIITAIRGDWPLGDGWPKGTRMYKQIKLTRLAADVH